MAWTDERIELLKKLWAEGKSASQIAAHFCGVSRSAVIGKVHRLGLSGRATTSRMKKHRPRARNRPENGGWRDAAGPSRAMAPTDIDALRRIESADDIGRVTFAELEDHHCRYPVGDPRKDGFKFCGDAKIPGVPYCYGHAMRCYSHTEVQRRNAKAPHRGPIDEALNSANDRQPAEKETVE